MKQKDIALFLFIGIISAVISVLASNFLFLPKEERSQTYEVVDEIKTEFITPNPKYFNKDRSINPTKRIQIGDKNNKVPFNGESTP